MGRLIGYARVSTAEQDLGLQLAALRSAGCSDPHIFCDTASGARTARPGLEACVHALEPGDTLVVWRLDRLGRCDKRVCRGHGGTRAVCGFEHRATPGRP